MFYTDIVAVVVSVSMLFSRGENQDRTPPVVQSRSEGPPRVKHASGQDRGGPSLRLWTTGGGMPYR